VSTFLVDECVSRDVAHAVRQAGHDIVLVRDVLPGAGDEAVVAYAREHGHIVLTEDRRFGFIAMNTRPSAGIVVLLMGNATPAAKAERLTQVLPSVSDSLSDAVTVISPTHVRRRKL